jgi:uncharacterized protein
MEIIGYISFIIMGIVLGLIGGGGSILTVPILVYILGYDAVHATSYSLFIVGIASTFGTIQYFRKSLVDIKAAFVFAIPSLISVFLTRAYLMPALPDSLFWISGFEVTKSIGVLILFAILMIIAPISMLKTSKFDDTKVILPQIFNYPMIFLLGFIVGMLAGLVGAGGGFLIIPALVILAKIPIKMAVGTSLLIISINSTFGFTGDMLAGIEIDWLILTVFSLLSIVGMYFGTMLSKRISGATLKKGFGFFVLAMGIFIIVKELIL